ncbi:MAG: MAC/perforin domain-containing protein [Tenuifilaceae bacterium]
MKGRYFLFLLLVLFSCKKENVSQPDNVVVPASTLTQLKYPNESGSSGDIVTGVLGYGLDITGFCDTISVKTKILDLELSNTYVDRLNSGFPSLITRDNFTFLMEDLAESDFYPQSTLALSSHIKSLWKLACKTDSIDSRYAFTYYSYSWLSHRYRIGPTPDFQTLLSASFRNDVDMLSAKDLISKYGTHLLTYVLLGKKIEVLYGIKPTKNNFLSTSQVEKCFFLRMNQFFGGTLGVTYSPDSEQKYNTNDELLIYNSIGCDTKQCGVLKPTDNNPDNIAIDAFSSFNSSEKFQFMYIDESGLLPLYDLVSEPAKKQEIKTYIDDYMKSNLNMHVW